MDVRIISSISKFTDDTKISSTVQGVKDNYKVQRDLDRLVAWADKWQMEFNSQKCKVMHIGKDNRSFGF